MIIKDIHIDGFGIFQNFSLTGLDKGINIIIGNNEAGKSTLLKFLRFTLFGYPRRIDQRMAPLQGGNHGGRIKVLLSSGDETVFERNGSDKIQILANGQEFNDSNTWNRFLGHATAGIYNNIYAFTLDELVGLASLEESGVEDKIFSLGLGLGNISISDLEKNITNVTEPIYTSRGRTQQIPAILKEIEENHRRIREIRNHLSEYLQLTADIELLEQDSQSSEEELKVLRQENSWMDKYLRCYESFLAIRRADKELQNLPSLHQLPEKGIALLEKNLERKAELSHRTQILVNGTSDEQGIGEIEKILEQTSVNVPLLENGGQVEFVSRNLENYKQTLKEKAEESDKIRALDKEISGTVAGKISSQWSEVDVMEFRDVATHRSRIDEFAVSMQNLRDELRDWQASEKTFMSQKSRFNAKAIAGLFALVLVIASVPAFYHTLYIIGGALLVAGFVMFFGRKAFQKENPLVPVKKKIREIKKELEELQLSYQSYLQEELKLSPELSIQSLPEIFQQIDYMKKLINQRDQLRQKVQEQRYPKIYDYESKVKMLGGFLQNPPQAQDTEMLANAVVAEYKHAEEQHREIHLMTEELNRRKKEHQQKLVELRSAEGAINELFAAAGVDNEDDFRKKYNENEQIINLNDQRKNALISIETIAGINKAEEVLQWLSEHDKPYIENRIAELDTLLEVKGQQTAELHKEKGSKIKEKERIAGESDLAEELTALETQRQKLRDAYKQWLTGQLALKVLAGVRSNYEREKQPTVIKNAGHYLGTITGGRYSGIRASLEGREMSVFDHRQASKNLDQLSRGTKEQLLVSLRLGFIEEYEKQSEPLPVVADEILVNFDPARARQAAMILQEFAAGRQMLIFTCHPATADFFDRDKIRVMDVNGNKS
ncbi:MAG: AAA family ATPase [Bacteroidales bacterium]|nr:AAA family ATPase [Bacteroidales bacterium]